MFKVTTAVRIARTETEAHTTFQHDPVRSVIV